jgi:hypothetical protein
MITPVWVYANKESEIFKMRQGVVFLIDEKMYNTRIIDKGKDNDRKI